MTRGLWTRETVALLLLAAYLPLAIFWLRYGGGEAALRLGLASLVLAAWNLVFLLARAQQPSFASIVTALSIAMLAPEDLGAFRLVLGISFGAVMGELVFGGWGRNVVNPATIAVSFLGFGFPAFPWPDFIAPVGWAAIPTVVIGIAAGIMPAATVAGAIVTAGGAFWLGLLPETALIPVGIVLTLLVTDPATGATTTVGKWLSGALYAGLAALFATEWNGAEPVQYAVAAALLTSLASPLLDEFALELWYARRRRRHGRT